MITALIKLLLACLVVASTAYYLFCIFAAKRFFSRPAAPLPPGSPPCTLLIPLCGADFRALENYASFCNQSYPEYQILFGVQDPADSSVAVVKELRSAFPDRDIELVIGSGVIGENPKVNNLNNMLPHARHEFLVLVDSDIRVGPDYLGRVVPPLLDEKVGLVTCLYRAGEAPGTAATLEAVGITGEFAPGVLAADLLEGISFAFGATIALRRSKLRAIGGFEAIADYLADDFMLGNLLWKAGFEIRLSTVIVETVLSPLSFRDMLKHQIRWARGIRACRPASHFGMIVTHGVPMGALFAILSGFSALGLLLLVLVVSARMLMARFVGVHCLGDGILKRYYRLVPIRDFMSFFIWLASLLGKNVVWRGRIYRILPGGKMAPIE